jgi:hypothetical protein
MTDAEWSKQPRCRGPQAAVRRGRTGRGQTLPRGFQKGHRSSCDSAGKRDTLLLLSSPSHLWPTDAEAKEEAALSVQRSETPRS